MIKKILVPTDASEAAEVGVRYALSLAKQHGATLHALHVIDIKLLEGPFLRDISASLGTAPYVNYQSNIAKILEERGQAALQYFQRQSEENNVRSEQTLVTGNIVRCIVDMTELMDMVVMGRAGEHVEWLEGLIGSTTEGVVRRAHCPVLVTGRESAALERVLVAYDGSSHAKKALQLATEIAEAWDVLFKVVSVTDDSEGDEELLEAARSYVEAHELKVEFISKTGDPSEVLVDYADEVKADLIVMGAYGHTKVREWVVGSTTAYTINHAPCPVLLTR